jgi:hypothetical protein
VLSSGMGVRIPSRQSTSDATGRGTADGHFKRRRCNADPTRSLGNLIPSCAGTGSAQIAVISSSFAPFGEAMRS